MHGEKITEDALYGVLKKLIAQWKNVTLEDYSCVESPLWPHAGSNISLKTNLYILLILMFVQKKLV